MQIIFSLHEFTIKCFLFLIQGVIYIEVQLFNSGLFCYIFSWKFHPILTRWVFLKYICCSFLSAWGNPTSNGGSRRVITYTFVCIVIFSSIHLLLLWTCFEGYHTSSMFLIFYLSNHDLDNLWLEVLKNKVCQIIKLIPVLLIHL